MYTPAATDKISIEALTNKSAYDSKAPDGPDLIVEYQGHEEVEQEIINPVDHNCEVYCL